jgi:hypothetical protein
VGVGSGAGAAAAAGFCGGRRARCRAPRPLTHPPTRPRPPDETAETKDTPDAPAAAKKELDKLGPLSRDEKITAFAFLITVALWIGGSSVGVNSVAAAIVGLTILLVTGAREQQRRRGGGGAV